MSNRLFQGIIHQMKDAIDRTIGVVDATGTVVCCSDLGRIGESDFVDIIKAIITEASMNGQYANINSIGNVIGEQYKLVSENPTETNDNSIKIDVNGREMYVSVVENWQMPLSIIKTHTALLANTSIAVKLSINSQALNFYLTDFEVAEPSLSLAVSSFCNYVKSCIK